MSYILSIANGFNNYVPRTLLNNIVIPPEFNNMETYFDKLQLPKEISYCLIYYVFLTNDFHIV